MTAASRLIDPFEGALSEIARWIARTPGVHEMKEFLNARHALTHFAVGGGIEGSAVASCRGHCGSVKQQINRFAVLRTKFHKFPDSKCGRHHVGDRSKPFESPAPEELLDLWKR